MLGLTSLYPYLDCFKLPRSQPLTKVARFPSTVALKRSILSPPLELLCRWPQPWLLQVAWEVTLRNVTHFPSTVALQGRLFNPLLEELCRCLHVVRTANYLMLFFQPAWWSRRCVFTASSKRRSNEDLSSRLSTLNFHFLFWRYSLPPLSLYILAFHITFGNHGSNLNLRSRSLLPRFLLQHRYNHTRCLPLNINAPSPFLRRFWLTRFTFLLQCFSPVHFPPASCFGDIASRLSLFLGCSKHAFSYDILATVISFQFFTTVDSFANHRRPTFIPSWFFCTTAILHQFFVAIFLIRRCTNIRSP